MPGQTTLVGSWVRPDGVAPASGTVTATRFDPNRVASFVFGGSITRAIAAGALPTSGASALKVTAPDSGSFVYTITERIADWPEVSYRIAVTAADVAAGTVDLSIVTVLT